jgi:hypothetical protein
MLAEEGQHMDAGALGQETQVPHEQLIALTDFIAEQLPGWRDHTDRPAQTGEDAMTYHLCAFLNGASRRSTTWGHLQFITQAPTEDDGRRKLDMTAQPLETELVFAGSRYTIFQPILPIECKRLPTPVGKDRDEREYAYSAQSTSGGIHRFKMGAHGAKHSFAMMIAYVQENTCAHWLGEVNGWIRDLSTSHGPLWSPADQLKSTTAVEVSGVVRMTSNHTRTDGRADIVLEHLWVRM